MPAYCHSYIQIWHWFDEAVIRREVGYAVNAGINSFRIFVGACQWQSHRETVCGISTASWTSVRKTGFPSC